MCAVKYCVIASEEVPDDEADVATAAAGASAAELEADVTAACATKVDVGGGGGGGGGEEGAAWSGIETERVGATESEETVHELVVAQDDEGDAKSGGPIEVKTGVDEESEGELGKATLVLESGIKELDESGMNELEDTGVDKTADELVPRAKVDPRDEAGVGAVHIELDDAFVEEDVDSALELEDL